MKWEPDPYRELVLGRLADLLERCRMDDLPELLWATSLGMLERTVFGLRERGRRFELYPDWELRYLRQRVAEAMALARFASGLRDAERQAEWEWERPGRESAEAEERARRRAQTLPAELARLANAAARRAAKDTPRTNFHLTAAYAEAAAKPQAKPKPRASGGRGSA